MTKEQLEAKMIERMLSGEPFTNGQMCSYRQTLDPAPWSPSSPDPDRIVNRTIQKLRRGNRIAFTREGRQTVWRAVAESFEAKL